MIKKINSNEALYKLNEKFDDYKIILIKTIERMNYLIFEK